MCIDASVAIKWVVQEVGTQEALALRSNALLAPDLLILECANTLWKKVHLALAMARGCRFITADDRLLRKLAGSRRKQLRDTVAPLIPVPNR